MGNELNIEQQYLNLIKEILENGTPKQPTRIENGVAVKVENGTIGIPHVRLQHDMSEGFPLYTHRKLPFKSAMVELQGFINGITSKKWYQDRKCFFWQEWCNKQSKEYKEYIEGGLSEKEAAKLTDSLGPIYGYQWRNFGEQYDYGQSFDDLCSDDAGISEGVDQLKNITNSLRNNPYDRRMVCTAVNPNQFHIMALIPCHTDWRACVYGDKLNLRVNIRSNDLILGNPNNVAFYAVLHLLLCKHTEGYTNLKPGLLTFDIDDAHIYENQIEVAKEIVKRKTRPFPGVQFSHSGDLFDWSHDKVSLIGYMSEPKINTKGLVTI
jgi:thymidylate synthase